MVEVVVNEKVGGNRGSELGVELVCVEGLFCFYVLVEGDKGLVVEDLGQVGQVEVGVWKEEGVGQVVQEVQGVVQGLWLR